MGAPIDGRLCESVERIAFTVRYNEPYVTTEFVGTDKEQYKIQYRHMVEIIYCLKNANGEFLKNSDPVKHETAMTDQPEVADDTALLNEINSTWFKQDYLQFSGNSI